MRRLFLCIFCIACSFVAQSLPPTISGFTPTTASATMTVTITGTNFSSATQVSFGGTAATSFTVVSPTSIMAVVGIGTTGQVKVTTPDGNASLNGFIYVTTSGIVTDFSGYWNSTMVANNTRRIPDTSHNLLAYTFNGITYSTGVNNKVLTDSNINFTPGNYKALPVAGITGTNGSTSTFLALGIKVDGSALVGNTPAVSNFSIKSVMVDGAGGLDLGTGVTNLPATANLTFQVFNINPGSVTSNEPVILLTQIASPSAGNDIFSFVDASGNIIGNTVTQDMTLLPVLGTYSLDLFNLSPNTPYDRATAYSVSSANGSREIRLTGFRLSDFGITASNLNQVKALRTTPSGTSDYAFIAYNVNAMNLPPNVSQNTTATGATICNGGMARLAVIGTPASGGTLSYSWEESANGGTSWIPVVDGGSYSGSTTAQLSIANAANAYKYRATVAEAGNGNPAVSTVFTIVVGTPAAPTSVSVTGAGTFCRNSPVQLTATATGGSNLTYQWQTNASGSYLDIPGATFNNFMPPVTQTGAISYMARVSSGSGCAGAVSSSAATVTVTGIASTVPASVCGNGALTLGATASSGTINWYADEATSTVLATSNSYVTPVLSTTKTYYVASSGCSGALRVPVVATVYATTVGGTVSGSGSVATGTNTTTLTLGGNTGSVVKWQSSTDGFNSATTDIENTSNQLVVNNIAQTTQYRTIVQSGTCATALSSVATITVNTSLPIHNSTVKASKQGDGVMIQWTAYSEQNTIRFEVERSPDGVNFTKVYTMMPSKSNETSFTYNWLDQQASAGNNFYRIREVYLTGDYEFTAIVKLVVDQLKAGMVFSPNPVSGRLVRLLITDMPAGEYKFSFIDRQGQTVGEKRITYAGGNEPATLEMPAGIVKGVYNVKVVQPGGKEKTYTLIVL